MKIAHRTADPKNIIAFGATITKETSPVAHLKVTAADGGSRMIEYGAFANLTANDVAIVDYAGDAPAPFKADASHTWDDGAPAPTDYEFPPSAPAPWPKAPAISRPRFDAVFAAGCGEAYYLRALRTLTAIGNTVNATDGTAAIARGMNALNNPPTTGIDFPLTREWKTNPLPDDLTGSLLYGVHEALKGTAGFEDIGDKIDASLAVWARLTA